MNSTPPRPTCTIRLTALPPPPPTPTTLMAARRCGRVSNVSRSISASVFSEPSSSLMRSSPSPRHDPLKEVLEDAPQPRGHIAQPAEPPRRLLGRAVAMRVHHKAHRRAEYRRAHVIRQPADVERRAPANRQVENLLAD